MVHGRPGWPIGYEHTRSGTFFNKRGITCLRLYMYSGGPNTRVLDDCTLETYSQDFETVVTYLRARNTPKVFGIGHSYGGLAILYSRAKLDAAVLLDPTHGSYWAEYPGMKLPTNRPLTEYEAMGDTTAFAAHKGYPLMILSAGKGKMIRYHDRYMAVADEPKAQLVIAEARHNMGNTPQILDEVRQASVDWLLHFM